MSICAGDLIIAKRGTWKVLGVHLGGAKQESVVEVSASENCEPASAHGFVVPTYFIPLELAEILASEASSAGLYRRAQ